MQGESLESLELEDRGVKGDRSYGVLDLGTGTVISAKREGRLLLATASLEGDMPRICLPDGEVLTGTGPEVDAALSTWLERPVRLVGAAPGRRATYERQLDFEVDDSATGRWEGPPGSFVDKSPLHVLTTSSLRGLRRDRDDLQVEIRRFRPNMLLDVDGEGFVEQDWIGWSLGLGGASLRVHEPCSRCVVTTREQPGGIVRQLDVLRHLNGAHGGNFGVRATVVAGGRVAVGQPVEKVPG
jgi:uncharacterized protein YcbX